MDYEYELERLNMLLTAIGYIIDQMMEHELEYPHAVRAHNTVLLGIVPTINVDCPYDPDCQISTPVPCGGLSDAIDFIEEAINLLCLEIALEEMPQSDDDATFDI